MMPPDQLIDQAARHVTTLFAERQTPALHYHNLAHTQLVVQAAQEIAHSYSLSEEERTAVVIAAWFHDVGYLNNYEDHETESAMLAHAFLSQHEVPEALVEQVTTCIEGTAWPPHPSGPLQEIICDADMAHLAAEDYLARIQDLRKEIKEHTGSKLGKTQWTRRNRQFFEKHRYFTDYAQTHYEPRKQQNYAALVTQVDKKSSKKKKKVKENIASREAGVLFRIVFRNHMDLSAIADTKANIMISVNSILLSVLVTVLFRNLDDYPNLWLPSAILVTVCLLAIVFAVLATLPRITHGSFQQGDERERRAKLLFFGNFHDMPIADFLVGMQQTIQDDSLVYDSLSRDLHYLGKVLHRKYVMLRRSYLVFVIGWVISIVAFVIASFYNAHIL
jgi:predicted metal-dependent HD superfamily phosphohydrolase